MNKIVGKLGEDRATKYLMKLKYKIIERNYFNPIGEIDIIAKDKDTLVFVEVKTRNSEQYGLPREAVNFNKQQKIAKVALSYLIRYRPIPICRFDVIEVYEEKLIHIIDAFTVN